MTDAAGPGAATVRFYAAARAAAGRPEARVAAPTLDDLRGQLVQAHGPRMAEVLAACSFLLDGVSVAAGDDAPLAGVSTVDVLPPFAGG